MTDGLKKKGLQLFGGVDPVSLEGSSWFHQGLRLRVAIRVIVFNKIRISMSSYIPDCAPEMSSAMEYSEVSPAI